MQNSPDHSTVLLVQHLPYIRLFLGLRTAVADFQGVKKKSGEIEEIPPPR
jgi:hypothetical protein